MALRTVAVNVAHHGALPVNFRLRVAGDGVLSSYRFLGVLQNRMIFFGALPGRD
jgi:hypothetical protein